MADDDVVLSRGAADLFGQIIGANVSALASTTDSIIATVERERDEFAAALVGIQEVLQDALVIDRRTERRLWEFAPEFASAQSRLEWNERSQ